MQDLYFFSTTTCNRRRNGETPWTGHQSSELLHNTESKRGRAHAQRECMCFLECGGIMGRFKHSSTLSRSRSFSTPDRKIKAQCKNKQTKKKPADVKCKSETGRHRLTGKAAQSGGASGKINGPRAHLDVSGFVWLSAAEIFLKGIQICFPSGSRVFYPFVLQNTAKVRRKTKPAMTQK